MPLRADVLRTVQRHAESAPPVALKPVAFFPAWCGVLVLAYDGFPEPLRALQREVGQIEGMPALLPGARWAKTTLATLREDAALTEAEGRRLLATCAELSDTLPETPVRFDRIAYVEFESRSLERRRVTERVRLHGGETTASASGVSGATSLVLAQGEDFGTYWPYLSRNGHCERHYREPVTGATLVLELEPSDLASEIDAFLAEIDRIVPGKYVRLGDESRHVTVHNLS